MTSQVTPTEPHPSNPTEPQTLYVDDVLQLLQDMPFDHPSLGKFNSLYHYWIWRHTGARMEDEPSCRHLPWEELLQFVSDSVNPFVYSTSQRRSLERALDAYLATYPDLWVTYRTHRKRNVGMVVSERAKELLAVHDPYLHTEVDHSNMLQVLQAILSDRVRDYVVSKDTVTLGSVENF